MSEISCESFTDVTVVANKLKLKGDEDVVHMLTNVRFVVNEGAILRVNVPVDFTGDDGQVRQTTETTSGAAALLLDHPRKHTIHTSREPTAAEARDRCTFFAEIRGKLKKDCLQLVCSAIRIISNKSSNVLFLAHQLDTSTNLKCGSGLNCESLHEIYRT